MVSRVRSEPLRFEPWTRAAVWGGRRLIEQLGKPAPVGGPCGESWEVSDHPLHHSVVASGPWAGTTLRRLMQEQPRMLLGPAAERFPVFPWLIKFLDAQDRLSVQVHPPAEVVARLSPGEGAKTEAWLVLDAGPEACIWAGLLPGVDEPALRAALRQGTVAGCLHRFVPRPGDCVFLPAGTVHAVGGGVLLAEVQQTSDATFRLYDWDRRDVQGKARTLHVEEALASMRWDGGPVAPTHVPDLLTGAGPSRRLALVRSPHFHLDYIEQTEPFPCGGQEQLQALLVVRGRGRLAGEVLSAGQTWLLPAAMAPQECVPEPRLGAVLCSLPG